ncbi:MAG: alpha/beta hydrolase [Alphaproteobacteria bacterium]|nr:alpha/beta hydrolase [Alphaproteobacteria bacterium]
MAIYRDYDRAALDAQYNNRLRVPDFAAYFARWKAGSDAARDRLLAAGARLDVAYGSSPLERLDIFPAKPADGRRPPVLVFIHGGYWRALDKTDFTFTAPPYVHAGITYVAINYGLVPTVSMDDILRQSRAALTWLYRNPGTHGGDVQRLYVSGHSAGGQLAPLVMGHDWGAQGLPRDLVKGAIAISGLFDLEPIRLSYLDEGMNLDAAAVRRLSPIHQVPPASKRQSPLVLCVGGAESPEFLRQQEAYAEAWAHNQEPARVVDAPGLNHFSVMDQMAEPTSALFAATRDLVLGRSRPA